MRLPAVPRLDRALASCADGASAAIVAACLCGSLLTAPPRAALAVDGAAALAEPAALTSSKAVSGNVADETWALIDKYYLDRTFNGLDWKGERQRLQKMEPMDDKQALEEAEKLVSSLGDKYSRVLDPVNAAKLNKYDVTGVGLNLIISDNGDMKVGAKPAPDSEAARAGIQFGELVLSINSQPTKGMTSFDALEAIQGEGRTVEITVKAADAEARQLTLTKAFVVKDPVKTRLVRTNDGKDAVGYIKLGEFNARCKKRVAEAIDELQAAGATKLVLDLRGNGGGVLDGALGISGYFIDKPLVLFITDANGSRQPLYSRQGTVVWRAPLEVWVNGRSASSSEVLAGALHDNCRARVVGSTTYGKGLIQGVFGLSDGGALVTTVASYATPSGTEINKLGVKVDESRTFYSDVLGKGFVDKDLKEAKFSKTVCEKPAIEIAAAPKGAATGAGRSDNVLAAR